MRETIPITTVGRELTSRIAVSRPSDPSVVESCLAVWDTGATMSVIEAQMAARLGLQPHGHRHMCQFDAKPSIRRPVYYVDLALLKRDGADYAGVVMPNLPIAGVEAVAGKYSVIIGMDVIAAGQLELGGGVAEFRI